jgi:hypothetical protein
MTIKSAKLFLKHVISDKEFLSNLGKSLELRHGFAFTFKEFKIAWKELELESGGNFRSDMLVGAEKVIDAMSLPPGELEEHFWMEEPRKDTN